jgi:hypothetical protein
MLQKNFAKNSLSAVAMNNKYQQSYFKALAITSALLISSVSHGAITPFSDDFQSYTVAPSNSGFAPWEYYSDNGGLGAYWGTPPTEPGPAISALTEFEGNQFLNFFANYDNINVHDRDQCDPCSPNLQEGISFFKEFDFSDTDTASGATWVFDFVFASNAAFPITGDTQTSAFIIVLDPAKNFLYVNDLDTTLANPIWTAGQLSVALDPNWTEGFLQIGFYNLTGNYDGSGMFYDDVNFAPAVPIPAAVWLFGSGLIGLVGIARRKKS